MKKAQLSFILIGITLNTLNAQITLNSSTHTPSVGRTYSYVVNDNSSPLSLGHSGANQTWNFSGAIGTTQNIDHIDVASSLDPTSFSTANLVESLSGTHYFYNSTSSSYNYLGDFTPGDTRTIYTNELELLNFPMTYLDFFSDTYSGTQEDLINGDIFSLSGTATINADGYGSLILPYATVNNVLKVTNTCVTNVTFGGAPFGFVVDTTITFYNSGTGTHIAKYFVQYFNGFLVGRSMMYISQTDLVTSIDDVADELSSFLVFPNPARDRISFSGNLPISHIEIYTVTGEVVKAVTMDNQNKGEVSLTGLRGGIYLIKYIGKRGSFTKKLIIE